MVFVAAICVIGCGGRPPPLWCSGASGDHGTNPTSSRNVHGAAAGQEDAGDSVDSAGKRDSGKGAPQITAIRPEAIIAGLFFMTGKSCRRPARQCLLSEFPKMCALAAAPPARSQRRHRIEQNAQPALIAGQCCRPDRRGHWVTGAEI